MMTGGESSRGALKRQSSASVCAEFNYRLGKTMGFGAFSKVKSAVHFLTGQKVAIKIINKEKMKDMEDKGVSLSQKLSCSFLTSLLHVLTFTLL